MERDQEELQFLGFFGILGESAQIISQKKHHRNIFFKITVTLILPLTFIFLAHSAITDLLSAKIHRNEHTLEHTTNNPSSSRYQTLSNTLSRELTQYWLIQATYLTFLLIFSLLSTSAVVYTIASLYSATNNTDLTFRKVISVVPKVWKRLLVTFLCNFGILVLYNFLAFILLVLLIIITEAATTPTHLAASIHAILIVFFGFYLVGFVYIGVVWHLASVVSVLEERCGIGAMRKSRELLRGKMTVAILVYLAVGFCSGGVKLLFEKEMVKSTGGVLVAGKVGYGVICFLLLSVLFLFGMVVQTVVYLVCKSYHHENIDKSVLASHLDAYLGEYVPLTATDIQMEHI